LVERATPGGRRLRVRCRVGLARRYVVPGTDEPRREESDNERGHGLPLLPGAIDLRRERRGLRYSLVYPFDEEVASCIARGPVLREVILVAPESNRREALLFESRSDDLVRSETLQE